MTEQANRYFTMAYGVPDPPTGFFRHVCAGHPGPVLIGVDGMVECHEEPNFPIGMVPDAEYEGSEIRLKPGERLYLHSDGLLEQFHAAHEQFGRDRLHAQLRAARNLPPQESVDSVIEAVLAWSGGEQLADDATVLAIERLGIVGPGGTHA